VTNVFANKTGEALARLSPNLVGVAPSLEGVVEGLRVALIFSRRARLREPAPG
jgi:hypothetical protein